MSRARSKSMTPHAVKRCQQRGISVDAVEYLMQYADSESPAGNGCVRIAFTRRGATCLRPEGLTPSMAENIARLAAIASPEGRIITVYKAKR